MNAVTLEELNWSLRLLKANKPDALYLYVDKFLRRDEMVVVFEKLIERIKQ